jgi:hypothetical protein
VSAVCSRAETQNLTSGVPLNENPRIAKANKNLGLHTKGMLHMIWPLRGWGHDIFKATTGARSSHSEERL